MRNKGMQEQGKEAQQLESSPTKPTMNRQEQKQKSLETEKKLAILD